MTAILHNRSPESSFSSQNLYIRVFYTLEPHALNGILSHNLIQQGLLSMNIIEILTSRILKEFPNITPKELALRLEFAQELLRKI